MLITACVSNGVGVALLIMLLVSNKEHFNKEKRTKYLLSMLYATMASCVSDVLAYLVDGKPGTLYTVLSYLLNSWLFLSVILITYYWIRLSYDAMGADMSKRGQGILLGINSIGLIALVVNCFYPLVFSTPGNVYQREMFYWVFLLTAGINIGYGLLSYYSAEKKGKLLIPLSSTLFLVPVIASVLIQTAFYGVSLMWVGISIGIVGIASAFKNKLIYFDSLTHVYNVYYLQELTRELENKENITLSGIMVDLNNFKKINDTFGHDIGDEALVTVAKLFAETINGYGTVCRCGGDEFLIILNSDNPDTISNITDRIQAECNRVTGTNPYGYELSVSVGSLVFRSAEQSFDNFYKELDALMYKNKQEYHRQHDGDVFGNRHCLGAVPLSPDILGKANIGLWAFELDEGAEPRMYVDDTMLGLIGLTKPLSPEETYHAWYDHIDSDSIDLISETVAKMTNGEHAEVQYPWHHPDGNTMIVRCGGVRNYEYKNGIRIEGIHQDVSQVIHFEEKQKQEEIQTLALSFLSSLSEEFLTFYIVNAVTGEYKIITRDTDFSEKVRPLLANSGNFFADMKDSIPAVIIPEDADRISVLSTPESFASLFSNSNSFVLEYRVRLGNETIRFMLKAVKHVGANQTPLYSLGIMKKPLSTEQPIERE